MLDSKATLSRVLSIKCLVYRRVNLAMDLVSIISIVVAVISACIGPICVYMFKRAIDRRDTKAKKAEEQRKKQEEELYEAKKRDDEHKHEI